jgi:hypothetical protein
MEHVYREPGLFSAIVFACRSTVLEAVTDCMDPYTKQYLMQFEEVKDQSSLKSED